MSQPDTTPSTDTDAVTLHGGRDTVSEAVLRELYRIDDVATTSERTSGELPFFVSKRTQPPSRWRNSLVKLQNTKRLGMLCRRRSWFNVFTSPSFTFTFQSSKM